jgi:type IV pilus assembly protein PilY1
MSKDDDNPILKTVCPKSNSTCGGDYDGDKVEPGDLNHSLDDVAKYLYDEDLLPDDTTAGKEYTIDKQNISTFTVGFGDVGGDTTAVALLTSTAKNGNGKPYLAGNQSELTTALTQVMSSIVSVDSSFVAPVVPVSPDNRTYNSNRIYMGFFKPVNGTYWEGNLKKYGLNANNDIMDSHTPPIRATDSTGVFDKSSISYWSTDPDAGKVNSGGAGGRLLLRDFSTDPRKIYTYTGNSPALTDSSNAFSKTNPKITATAVPLTDNITTRTVNVADDTEKAKLIDFIYGINTYDENFDGNITSKRSWIFGDILHSKPLVVNYAQYDTKDTLNEGKCLINKSIIYVASNDGMLHAIKDCDGNEAWAFIPPEVLANLKEIPQNSNPMATYMHTYTVDSSPAIYIYDANKDGNIDTSTDKVIMMIGMRRGGGKNTTPTDITNGKGSYGSYYALDITDPVAPKYLWSISNSLAAFSELGESWGEPKIVKMKIGTAKKMVVFISGGYDNLNEDSRYGATQNFTGTGTVENTTSGAGSLTSMPVTPAVAQSSPKGRAVYAVEIATLNSVTGAPTIPTTATRVWGVVNGVSTSYSTSPATDAGMTFSIASDISTLDVDGDGYIDRLYAADLGGNLWRFDVGSPTVTAWTGNKIFSANPATGADTGRKVFYKPSVTLETSVSVTTRGNDATILMGSGDREHPSNIAVTDRMYSIKDKGQTTVKYESNMIDVTLDDLQTTTTTSGTGSIADLLAKLNAPTNYGWYIKLDQNAGEKTLASPALLNKIVYFTTFAPGTSTSTDPCKPSNLGTSRLYVLNYATGESVMNYDTTNDTTAPPNGRAKCSGKNCGRADRGKTIGSGISSGVVIAGDKAFIGAGGSIVSEEITKGGRVINLYWGQK